MSGDWVTERSRAERRRFVTAHRGSWYLPARPYLPPVLLLAVAAAPFPALAALLLLLAGWGLGWPAAALQMVLPAMAALYAARLVHELGHLGGMGRNFRLTGVYAPRWFTALRLELGAGVAPASGRDWRRMMAAGSVANLAAAAVLALGLAAGPRPYLALVVLAQLVIGVGNLLPVPGTDGHRLWQHLKQRRRRQ